MCIRDRRCRIQLILKQLVRSYLDYIGNGDQLIQLWCFDSALDHAHMVNAVINSGSKLFLRHTGKMCIRDRRGTALSFRMPAVC